jgi:hypothetical protein
MGPIGDLALACQSWRYLLTASLPKLPKNHDSELYGWVEDLPELSDYLRRLGYVR